MTREPGRRFLIVDDHPLFRGALARALHDQFPDAAIEEAGRFDELAARLSAEAEPDLVFLDLAMPGARGFSALIDLRGRFATVPIVVVSATDEPGAIRRALTLGASGYIPKSTAAEAIRGAVQAVLAGEVWVPDEVDLGTDEEDEATVELARRIASLTPQQKRVLAMLREGLLNKQIAYALDVSEATIKAHVSAILQKLGVDSRTQAVIAAAKIDGELWTGEEA
jgi:DNA-binding NarL/FixJ family response regulator